MDTYFVYVTVGSEDEARRLAEAAVAEGLAACANILRGMQSIYRWQGEICHDTETVLILKTTAARFPDLRARLADLHSYECPCIVALPIVAGHEPYLDWLQQMVQR